jgi:predicted GIY-YIG superfamily endonuclease
MSKPSKETKEARKLKLLEPSNQTLYRFFNAKNELLYVGITNNPFNRFSGHSKDKEWFKEITYSTFEHYPNRLSVDRAETKAIQTENPKYNKAKVKGWERSPDHMRKIRMRKIENHDLLMGIIFNWSKLYNFGKDIQRDSWIVIHSINHAKTLGHRCEICDAILINKAFVQHYNRQTNQDKKQKEMTNLLISNS